MYKSVVVFVVSCFFYCGTALASSVVLLESASRSAVHDVAVGDGLVVASASFSQSVSIGKKTWSAAKTGYLLLGLNADGSLRWAKSSPVQIQHVSMGDDSVYITAKAGGLSDFMGCKVNVPAGKGFVVAQINVQGVCRWQMNVSSSEMAMVSDVASRGDNGVLLVGNFKTDLSIDEKVFRAKTGKSIFAIKMNAAGDTEWVKLGHSEKGSLKGIWAWSASMGPQGEVVIAGDLSGSASWAGTTLASGFHEFAEGRVPRAACFVTKLDDKGGAKWSRVVSTGTLLASVAMGFDSSVYLVGNMNGNPESDGRGFGPEFGIPASSTGEKFTIWLAKLDMDGRTQWVRSQYVLSSGQSVDLAFEERANAVTLVGIGRGRLKVEQKVVEMNQSGKPDLYHSRYGLNGQHMETIVSGGAGKDYANAIDSGNDLLVTVGTIQGNVTLGKHPIASAGLAVTNGFIWLKPI